jgi:uncharacterized protein YfdQ (DUF2303 family)
VRYISADGMPHAMVMHDGEKLQSLETLRPTRDRFKGNYLTRSIGQFVKYCREQEESAGTVFIDPDKMAATLIVDIGTHEAPGHCDHTAVLTLHPTAAFAAWGLYTSGSGLSQREAVEFLQDNADSLSATTLGDDPQTMPIGDAIKAISDVKILQSAQGSSRVHDLGAAQSIMESIEASSEKGLPAAIVMNAQPYEGFDPREFVARLIVNPGNAGEKPAIKFRWMRKEHQVEQVAEEFAKIVGDGIDGKAAIYLGNFAKK